MMAEWLVEWRSSSDHRNRLAAALEDVRRLPYADRIVVFGSMGRGDPLPGDVDLIVEVDGSVPPYDLLAIARRHYGLIDPFVRMGPRGRLLVRDDDAVEWKRARNVRSIMLGMRTDGRPLADVRFQP